MYNSVINDWKDVEHQIPFDVRQPKTHAYTLRRLREYLESHPYVNVVRFTTFFHLFTLVFDELRREKYVDWYGYSASVSPYILEQFEKEVGYKFRPEFIIDQGYYNNQYRVPSKEYKDFQAFQRREVAGLMKEMTDIVHEYGKEADDVLGRPLDRLRAVHAGIPEIRRRCHRRQCRQRQHPAPDFRHPRRQVHRGTLPALLLPRYLPRGRRPCARGQGELGHRPPRHPAQAH